MGFVCSDAEIAAIQQRMAAPTFGPGRQVVVEFRTDPVLHRRLLPPPLEVPHRATAAASVGSWESDVVGRYSGGTISLAARHDGVLGMFPVAMWMNTDAAVLYGRDVFGEPKKLAETHLEVAGDRVTASVVRRGTTLMALEARLDAEVAPAVHERHTFNVCSRTAPSGRGLAQDATLTRARFTATATRHRTGAGGLTLTSGPLDPVAEIPVVEVLGASYQEHTMTAECAAVGTIPAEVFLPWHVGRLDDPRVLAAWHD